MHLAKRARLKDPFILVVGPGERVADGGEGRGELRADRRKGADDHDGYESCDEAVLDCGRALAVLDEGQKQTTLLAREK